MLSKELRECVQKLKTVAECKEAWELIKQQWDILEAKEALKFFPGQKVYWIGTKTPYKGIKFTGVIEKINRKTVNIVVNSPVNGKWKVSPQYVKLDVVGDEWAN